MNHGTVSCVYCLPAYTTMTIYALHWFPVRSLIRQMTYTNFVAVSSKIRPTIACCLRWTYHEHMLWTGESQFDIFRINWYIHPTIDFNLQLNMQALIERGGGTGPMKPKQPILGANSGRRNLVWKMRGVMSIVGSSFLQNNVECQPITKLSITNDKRHSIAHNDKPFIGSFNHGPSHWWKGFFIVVY